MFEVLESYDQLLKGAWVTIQLTLLAAVLALVLAMLFGLAGTSRNRGVRAFNRVYVEFFRGTAALVLMYWFFYSLPLVGFRLTPLAAGVVALGLNLGAYGAEVVRGSILAVPKAQYEATVALNFTPYQRMRRVLLPQAVALMLPPAGNLLIELLKATAVVSLIAVQDLMYHAKNIVGNTGESLWTYAVILVIFFVIAQLLQVGVRLAERRVDRMLGRRRTRKDELRDVAASAPGTGVMS